MNVDGLAHISCTIKGPDCWDLSDDDSEGEHTCKSASSTAPTQPHAPHIPSIPPGMRDLQPEAWANLPRLLNRSLMKLPSQGHRAPWHEAPAVGPSGRQQVVEPYAGNRTCPESGSERSWSRCSPPWGLRSQSCWPRAASEGL